MNSLSYKPFYRRHLPHYQPPGSTLFVTFRLAGSLPAEVLQLLKEDAGKIDARLKKINDPKARAKQTLDEYRNHFERWDAYLDKATYEPHWLQKEAIASLVFESIHYRDGKTFTLEAFTVMPNHVHMLFTPLSDGDTGNYYALPAIMHSLKRYTAREANKLLGRDGTFWQAESYDHVVRNQDEMNRIIRYILDNPVKAGLVRDWKEWRWSYCKYEL